MDVAFILHVNVQDISTLADEAASIQDDLTSAGHDVVSVEPWTRPTSAPTVTMPLIGGLTPPPTQPITAPLTGV